MDFTITFWHEYILIKVTHKLSLSCRFPALLPPLSLHIESFSPQVFIYLKDGVIQWSLEFSPECGQPLRKMLFPQQLLTACRLTRHSGRARFSWGRPWSVNSEDSTLSVKLTDTLKAWLFHSFRSTYKIYRENCFLKNPFSFQHSTRVA